MRVAGKSDEIILALDELSDIRSPSVQIIALHENQEFHEIALLGGEVESVLVTKPDNGLQRVFSIARSNAVFLVDYRCKQFYDLLPLMLATLTPSTLASGLKVIDTNEEASPQKNDTITNSSWLFSACLLVNRQFALKLGSIATNINFETAISDLLARGLSRKL